MKSKATTWSKTAHTKHQLNIQWGVGRIKYDLSIPAGTRCFFLGTHWVVGDLNWLHNAERTKAAKQLGVPESRITQLSMVGHDAEHYGITVDEADLEDIKDV